jgi:4-hydroxybenzoate polyprenyltransferase
MALAVWMLYAGDRLMDARLLDINPTRHNGLEARHYFHHRHRTGFLMGILLSSIALGTLLPHLDAAAIRLYLILGGLVAVYFILVHATSSDTAQRKVAHRLPKEIAVGLCFAAATFIPTVARRPELHVPQLPIALLFASLCSLNCLFIYAWEHDDQRIDVPAQRIDASAHAITRFALGNLPGLTGLLIFCSMALIMFDRHVPWPVPCAIAVSAAILFVLHDHRQAMSRTILRAAADLALTTPILLFPFVLR